VSRLPVFGTVSLPNAEGINGSITFVPTEGNHGPAALAKLTDGKYQFDRTNGPTVGPHQVIVKRTFPRSRVPTPNGSDQKGEAVSAGIKTEWKLNANLKEQASNQYNFTLEP
jgi:hypothetical protein